MKAIPVFLLGALAATAVLAQEPAGSQPEQYQAPVEEGVDLPDSPAADEAQGNAEAQMPAVEQDDAAEVDEPSQEGAPAVEQPAVEP